MEINYKFCGNIFLLNWIVNLKTYATQGYPCLSMYSIIMQSNVLSGGTTKNKTIHYA